MRVKYTRVARVRVGNRVTLKRGGNGSDKEENRWKERKAQVKKTVSEEKGRIERAAAAERITKEKREQEQRKKRAAAAPAVPQLIDSNPIAYFEQICRENGLPDGEINDLIKDKHALDNQHDFTADRGDFVPDATFIYYMNNLFNKSAAEASTDIILPGNTASAIIDRNVKLQTRGIRFGNLEWDTFNYFSRMLPNRFSCTPEAGLVYEEVAISDLMDNSGKQKPKFNDFKAKQHIVLNSADWDPTDDEKKPAMELLGQFYLEFFGFNKDEDVYLNFDAKTKGTFTKPLRLCENVKQIITYQNMFDSGTNMFSILSDNTKDFDRTEIVKSADALDIVTSNYFSQKIAGRNYNMAYLHNTAYDSSSSAVAIKNIFGWAKMDISGVEAAGGVGAKNPIVSQYLLQTSVGTTNKIDLPQRGGPGVGVLANYIETHRNNCKPQPTNSDAKKDTCKRLLNSIEQQKGFDTVRISQLLGDAYTFSDVIKLCVDIKGGGDAEQVNAIWHLYHHKRKSCIMITGDILCYMYSIIMGLPSVLIISNKIYMSKGIPKEPPTQKDIYKNKINNSMTVLTGIVKTCSDIIKATENIDKLINNIIDGIFKKNIVVTFGAETPEPDTQQLVNALIQIKALDIVNYLATIKKVVGPIADEVKTVIDGIKLDHDLLGNLYSQMFALNTNIIEEDEGKLKAIIDTISSKMAAVKKQFQDFNMLLGNFKNKKYVTDIGSFVNGFTSLEFYTAKTTIKTYELFDYDRDKILRDFADVIKKIKTERYIADKNPRFFLGKQIRSKFQDFIKSLFSTNMLDIGLDAGFFKDVLQGYDHKIQDVKETAFYKSLETIISDANIIYDRNSNIANQLLSIINPEINKIKIPMSILVQVAAVAAGAPARQGAVGASGNAQAGMLLEEDGARQPGRAAAGAPARQGAAGASDNNALLEMPLEEDKHRLPGGAAAGTSYGGDGKIVEIQNSIKTVIKLTKDLLLICKNNNIEIKNSIVDYKQLVDNELSIDIVTARTRSQIYDTFREILQDAYFINLAKPNSDLEEYINSSYEKIFNKWNDLRYSLEINKYTYALLDNIYDFNDIMIIPEIKSFDDKLKIISGLAKNYENATFNQHDKIAAINQIAQDLLIFEDEGELSEEEDNLGEMIKHRPTTYNPYAGLVTPMYTGLGGQRRAKTSNRSYGEKSLTKMLKDIKLNKSKKHKQRKTRKNNKN